MAVVAVLGLVLDVGDVDGDAASLLLRRVVDVGVELRFGEIFVGEDLCDGGCEGGFAVIDVSDGSWKD